MELSQFSERPWFPSQRFHERLLRFNERRLQPSTPRRHSWRDQREEEEELLLVREEGLWIEAERARIAPELAEVPTESEDFLAWFEALKFKGPGQNDALFPWIADEASLEDLRWFITQEVAGEAGFDDLVALTQVKMPVRAKLEMARNYWDEMGRGQEKGMHGLMLSRLAEELGIENRSGSEIVSEALALGNLLIAFASHRCYAFHSVGALGVIELTAPARAEAVARGLKRLGLRPEAVQYYALHATLDVKHSRDWNEEVLRPLILEDPQRAHFIAEGAWLRLEAGARCFERYRRRLKLS